MRVVLDTNVLISGIFWKGVPHSIVTAWVHGKFKVVISKHILDEYQAVLRRIDTKGQVTERWMSFVIENAHVVQDVRLVKFSRDSTDDVFLNTAIIGKADYLVSGDDDLLSLAGTSPVAILNPRTFAVEFHLLSSK